MGDQREPSALNDYWTDGQATAATAVPDCDPPRGALVFASLTGSTVQGRHTAEKQPHTHTHTHTHVHTQTLHSYHNNTI